MNKVRGIVFDLDGTLLDTMAYSLCVEDVYRIWYPESSVEHDFFLRAHAYPQKRTYEEPNIPFEKWGIFRQHVIDRASHVTEPQKLFPESQGTLVSLKRRGYRLGVNTSRTQEGLENARMVHPELFSLFDEALCVTVSQISRPKPAPDSLLHLLEHNGLAPEELFFIGDSDYDKCCARDAGVPFGWAAWGWHFMPDCYEEENDVAFKTQAEVQKLFDEL